MNKTAQGNEFFGTAKVWKLLLKLAPPVMFAQLIQALYNIVDSYFIGQYSGDGLSALSVIYPIQLLIQALASLFACGQPAGVRLQGNACDSTQNPAVV